MASANNQFHKIGIRLKTEPIQRFRRNSPLTKKYLKVVQGKDINPLLIGWICERDSFFAYMYKRMKREARDSRKTQLASGIARAGFPVMLPAINKWISRSVLPVLIVPVPSRHGVSERFVAELYNMLDSHSKKASKVEKIFARADKTLEIKKINSWTKRNRAVRTLFPIKEKRRVSQYAVLLVDDIITSGASLRKAARSLKRRGVKSIAAVALSTNLFDSYSYRPPR